jgi:hypothetical protein
MEKRIHRKVTATRPDIIIKNKEKTCKLTCGNTSGQKRHAQRGRKATTIQELCAELKRMWIMKCMIVSVITGATGIVTEGLKTGLEAIPGKHSTDSPQKTAVLETSHIIWTVLQCET